VVNGWGGFSRPFFSSRRRPFSSRHVAGRIQPPIAFHRPLCYEAPRVAAHLSDRGRRLPSIDPTTGAMTLPVRLPAVDHRRGLVILLALAALPAAAQTPEEAFLARELPGSLYQCVRDAHVAAISVEVDDEAAGVPCRVVLSWPKDGRHVLWRAEHQADFCPSKAHEKADLMTADGWRCMPLLSGETTVAAAGPQPHGTPSPGAGNGAGHRQALERAGPEQPVPDRRRTARPGAEPAAASRAITPPPKPAPAARQAAKTDTVSSRAEAALKAMIASRTPPVPKVEAPSTPPLPAPDRAAEAPAQPAAAESAAPMSSDPSPADGPGQDLAAVTPPATILPGTGDAGSGEDEVNQIDLSAVEPGEDRATGTEPGAALPPAEAPLLTAARADAGSAGDGQPAETPVMDAVAPEALAPLVEAPAEPAAEAPALDAALVPGAGAALRAAIDADARRIGEWMSVEPAAELAAEGDLNGDGLADAVVFLTYRTDDDAFRQYLMGYVAEDDGYTLSGVRLLTDAGPPPDQATVEKIDQGVIWLHLPGRDATDPAGSDRLTFTLDNDQLVELDPASQTN
jgi:hypothetical protein